MYVCMYIHTIPYLDNSALLRFLPCPRKTPQQQLAAHVQITKQTNVLVANIRTYKSFNLFENGKHSFPTPDICRTEVTVKLDD